MWFRLNQGYGSWNRNRVHFLIKQSTFHVTSTTDQYKSQIGLRFSIWIHSQIWPSTLFQGKGDRHIHSLRLDPVQKSLNIKDQRAPASAAWCTRSIDAWDGFRINLHGVLKIPERPESTQTLPGTSSIFQDRTGKLLPVSSCTYSFPVAGHPVGYCSDSLIYFHNSFMRVSYSHVSYLCVIWYKLCLLPDNWNCISLFSSIEQQPFWL